MFENLAIGLRRKNFAETEIKKRIAAVAGVLGLEAQLQSNAQSLQPEQRRLVGLARAMVRQPKVYLFDEPLGGLDSEAARRGRAEIVGLHQRSSATIIYATELAAEALAFGERTVVLVDGVIQQDGPARDVYDCPANLRVAKFFGDPPMNLVTGTIKQERSALVFSEAGDGTIALTLSPDRHSAANHFLGKPVVLGFRPEDIALDSPSVGEPGGARFRALLERVERGASGADLYLQTGAHSLIASGLRTGDDVIAGQRLHFAITVEKSHLFDPASGRRLTWQL